jgi:hypothetical protein
LVWRLALGRALKSPSSSLANEKRVRSLVVQPVPRAALPTLAASREI